MSETFWTVSVSLPADDMVTEQEGHSWFWAPEAVARRTASTVIRHSGVTLPDEPPEFLPDSYGWPMARWSWYA